MYNIKIDHTLRRIIQVFYHFGVWRNEEESFRKTCMRLPYLLQEISFLIFLLTCACTIGDKNEKILLIETGINVVVLIIKLFYILHGKDEILKFLYDPTITHCISDYAEWMEVNKKIGKILKFIQAYAVLLIVSVLVVVSLPIFASEKSVPLFIRFNVESYYDEILYWLTYIYITIGCLFSVMYNFVIILIWYIMFNYSIEYKILGNQFRKLGYPTKGTSKITARNSYHKDLIGLIQAQKKLFDTVERFRSYFSTLFLAEIFTGAISICGSIYNFAYNTPENFFQMGVFVTFILWAFFEIFLNMYLANEITMESDQLSYCLFESNWIEQSEATKKCVIIYCEMIKQPQQLIIFIYPMNLETFSSVANGAYSMFNILQSFNN